jgi:hypothetical protein
MADLPGGRLSHLSVGHLKAGRLRIRIPDKRRDDAFFVTVAERLSGWPSVERVEVNPLTASVLIMFSDADALFEEIERNGLFVLDTDPASLAAQEHEPTALTERARRLWAGADTALRRVSGGSADIRNTAFLVLLASALYQLWRGQVVPPALTSLWYAGDMLSLWRSTADEAPPSATGKAVAGD